MRYLSWRQIVRSLKNEKKEYLKNGQKLSQEIKEILNLFHATGFSIRPKNIRKPKVF